jgi:RimJ/RimL family protein N-acetyltransferase
MGMERILIFIKHHLRFIWGIIEKVNARVFTLFFGKRLQQETQRVFSQVTLPAYEFRELEWKDLEDLWELLQAQPKEDLEYFKPHDFDLESLRKQKKNSAFYMMGVWEGQKIIGYFFLRFFLNKKCFVGRLIDGDYRGKGIGGEMNRIMYETAWNMKFRCLSTISRNNTAVMKAHSKNQAMVVLKELDNDFLLVEFIKKNPIEAL